MKNGCYLSHWNGAAGFPKCAKIWIAGVKKTRKKGAITSLEKCLMRDHVVVWDSDFFAAAVAGCCCCCCCLCCLIFFSIGAGAGVAVFFLLCLRAITHPIHTNVIQSFEPSHSGSTLFTDLHNKFLEKQKTVGVTWEIFLNADSVVELILLSEQWCLARWNGSEWRPVNNLTSQHAASTVS